jgi:sigma-E factor negative regulatory protein RseA
MSDESLKEKLSALVDNELDELSERRLLAQLEGDIELRCTWERYHLMRAALKRETVMIVTPQAAEQAARRLDAEPVSGVSHQRRPIIRALGTLAIAASVAVIAITGVQWTRSPVSLPAPTAMLVAQEAPPQKQNIILSADTSQVTKTTEAENALNAYLVEHDEFASTSGLGGMMPYVRVVGHDSNK